MTVVALSLAVAADVAQTLDHFAEITTIHSAIDLDQSAPGPGQGSELDHAAGLPPVAAGYGARWPRCDLHAGRGNEVFLEAASQVPGDRLCRFYIIGGPIYRSAGSQHTVECC